MSDPYAVLDAPPDQSATIDPYAVLDQTNLSTVKPSAWWDTAKDVNDIAGAALRSAINPFGLADRFAGYMTAKTGIGAPEGQPVPKTYDEAVNQQVAQSEAIRAQHPVASAVGDVGSGALAAALLPELGGAALAGKTATALAPQLGRIAPYVGRAIGYGAEGAGLGAAQGAGQTYTGNLPDYVNNAIMGGVIGLGTGGILGSVAGGAARPSVSKAAIPTQGELYAAKKYGYDALNQNQAAYTPGSLAQHADDLEHYLVGEGYAKDTSPSTWRALDQMRGAPPAGPGPLVVGANGAISPSGIDLVRKGLNRISPATDPTDAASGGIVRKALDDFIARPPAGAVVPGTEAAAKQASWLADWARQNYAGLKRTEAFDNLVHDARLAAGSQNSGLNVENKLRGALSSFVRRGRSGYSPADLEGFNPAEINTLENYATGSAGPNTLRWLGNLTGGGGGPMSVMTGSGLAGAAATLGVDPKTSGELGGAVPVGAFMLRALANRRATRGVSDLRDLIAKNNPLYQSRVAVSGTQPGPSPLSSPALERTRNAIINLLVPAVPQEDANAP